MAAQQIQAAAANTEGNETSEEEEVPPPAGVNADTSGADAPGDPPPIVPEALAQALAAHADPTMQQLGALLGTIGARSSAQLMPATTSWSTGSRFKLIKPTAASKHATSRKVDVQSST